MLNSLPPRTQGLATIVIAAGVGLVGLLVARVLGDQFYPIVFPMAGLLAGMGLFQAVSGHSRDDLEKQRVPRAAVGAMFLLNLLGVLCGLGLNRFLYGVWW